MFVICWLTPTDNLGRDGKPVYGGTSDIIDDFDCAYTIIPVKSQADSDIKVVEFENIKRRGNVIRNVGYSYSNKSDISYSQLLASVQLVDDTLLPPMKLASELQSDAEKICAVVDCIKEGINTKMKLAIAVSSRIGISRASAIQMIEKYTGVDPAINKWSFSAHERGANVSTVLEKTQHRIRVVVIQRSNTERYRNGSFPEFQVSGFWFLVSGFFTAVGVFLSNL